MHLLLVEDDERLSRALTRLLEEDRHVVEHAPDGRTGLELATAIDGLDAVILDIGLPDMSGLDVARRIRKEGVDVSILMLTARDTVNDRVTGLDAGADDYVVKPFAYQEVAARLRALGRRAESGTRRAEPKLRAGVIELDEAARRVTVDGANVDLSPREFSLLEALLRHAGHDAHARPAAGPRVAVQRRGDAERGRRLRPLPAHQAGRRGVPDRDGPRGGIPPRRCLTAPRPTRGTRRRAGRPRRRRPADQAHPLAPRRLERAVDARRPHRPGGRALRGRSRAPSSRPRSTSSTPGSTRSRRSSRATTGARTTVRTPAGSCSAAAARSSTCSTTRAGRCRSVTGAPIAPDGLPLRAGMAAARVSPDGEDVRTSTLAIEAPRANRLRPDPRDDPRDHGPGGRQRLLRPGPRRPHDRGRDAQRAADRARGRRRPRGAGRVRVRRAVRAPRARSDPAVARRASGSPSGGSASSPRTPATSCVRR